MVEQTGTRERVLSLLLDLGPSTTTTLSERLSLSPAAVRRHLDALLADGTVTTRAARTRGLRARGRPARLYALTDAGHAAGPSAYDDLAAGALRYLAEHGGPQAVEGFAAARVADLEDRWSSLRELPVAERPAALATALTADGYAATTGEQGHGIQLCQHHCPVQHVAEQFPQLCDAETAAIGRLLDVHVQRLATIAHGDGVCTTYIPTAQAAGTTPAAPAAGTTPAAPAAGHDRAAAATHVPTGKAVQ
jgi:predicted ArsR family transcriptional regulator